MTDRNDSEPLREAASTTGPEPVPADPDTAMAPAILAAWEASVPPSGFADRVMTAWQAQEKEQGAGSKAVVHSSRPSRKLAVSAAVVGTACVGALVLALLRGEPVPSVSGRLVAMSRTTEALGHRGVAVAEPGAALAWQIEQGNAVMVEQSTGDVFYRVDPGGPFVVRTPVGEVSVTGTCFRVEVDSMKLSRQALIGAAAGAALVVTVYEGRVLLANDRGRSEVAAGQRVLIAARGEAPSAPESAREHPERSAAAPVLAHESGAYMDPAPAENTTREQLLERDKQQREELAALRANVQRMSLELTEAGELARKADGKGEDDGRPWFDPGPETLQQFARECKVRYDVPPITGLKPRVLDAQQGARMGLDDVEREIFNRMLADTHTRWRQVVREIYLEATGNTEAADTLSPEAMARDIEDKSMPGEGARVQKRIAEERAGLIAPPADWSQASPIERYYRSLSTLGGELEAQIGSELGPDRARALRERNQGWGGHHEVSGCPSDEGPEASAEP